eukprot:CAMPEP_0119519694 /NCGR_PEP_ID=MMETSP1344-20130328/35914_1 /TAXON_ID=236787 /ORGANISM="Florenciella parvula, Strain CCMP2471" /LENGTH=332 /DNA_ID=CAMNT_0007557495 /DNA_START=21 /DNA_END=1015 /DNA_ORIENTATION=+
MAQDEREATEAALSQAIAEKQSAGGKKPKSAREMFMQQADTMGALGDEESVEASEAEGSAAEDNESIVANTPLVYKLQVLGAFDLAKTDRWGECDPFAVATLNGEKVAECPVVPYSRDPRFRNMVIDVPDSVLQPEGEDRHRLEETDCLIIDLYDSDKAAGGLVSSNEFLGQVRLKPENLRSLVGIKEEVELAVLPGTQKSDKKNKHVQGRLEICAHRMRGIPRFELDILSACDLAKADFFGWSDPFCIVYWDGKKLGQSDVQAATLNPRWEECKWKLPLKVPMVPGRNMDNYKPELRIEMWDMDKKMGVRRKGDFLGELRLLGPKLLRPGR